MTRMPSKTRLRRPVSTGASRLAEARCDGLLRRAKAAALVAGLLAAGALATEMGAQTERPRVQLPTELSNIRFNSGQSVVPYFEGWIRNPDGTFDVVFGYFNRNWQQELAIPAGPDNNVEPGGPDSGQPTFFLPRRQRFVFRVRVPASFGKNEVVWTITANGRTERGYGTLQREQEITERVVMTNGGFDPGSTDPNKPPSITIAPIQSPMAGSPVTLIASVADDGLPKPRPAPTPSTRPTPPNSFGAQINSSTDGPRPMGLTVRWLQYGGPAKVTFDATSPVLVTNGRAVTTARFPRAGTYQLVALANDRSMTTRIPITVTVRAAATEP
jgi:hypothetical protein